MNGAPYSGLPATPGQGGAPFADWGAAKRLNPEGKPLPTSEPGAPAGPPLFWAPTFGEAIKWAWKPLLIFFLFSLTGSIALSTTLLAYEPSGETALILGIVFSGGMLGVLIGQVLALLRLRLLLFSVVTYIIVQIMALTALVSMMGTGAVGAYIGLFIFCVGFGLPSGMMSLHHRLELLAAFWPSIGWIGSVFVILNHEGKAEQWQENKLTAWMPIPLALLFGFIVFLLLFLASKQTMRVELWQALSGSAARRTVERASLGFVPKKNLVWLAVVAIVLFGVTAVLSPYLFRSGKGDREGDKNGQQHEPEDDGDGDGKGQGKQKQGKGQGKRGQGKKGQGKKGQGKKGHGKKGQGKDGEKQDGEGDEGDSDRDDNNPFDEDALERILEQMANAAKKAVWALLPLLLLAIFFRPIRRAFLATYLRLPLLPTTPSERIVYLWEYVRIAVEDTGLDLPASDAVEETIERVRGDGLDTTDLEVAGNIYMRARYDMVLRPQDPIAMRGAAERAAKAMRRTVSFGRRITNLWRALG